MSVDQTDEELERLVAEPGVVTDAFEIRGLERTMVLLRDSYPSFGSGGNHLQPLDAVEAAIRRDDGREGGCLLFISVEHVAEAELELKQLGFDIGTWDNGTPYEQGGER